MVRIVLLVLIFLYGCISLKSDKSWDNSLNEVIDVQLIVPDMAYVGDTVSVGVKFLNKTSEQVCFYEPGFVALIEDVNNFSREGIILTLEEKQLREVSKIFELKKYDSIVKNYKLVLDSTEFRRSAEIPFRIVLWSMPPCKKKNYSSCIKKGSLRSSVKTINVYNY